MRIINMRRGDIVKDIWGSIGVVQRVIEGTDIVNHGEVEVLIIKPSNKPGFKESYEKYGYMEHYCHFNAKRTLKVIIPARSRKVPYKKRSKHV